MEIFATITNIASIITLSILFLISMFMYALRDYEVATFWMAATILTYLLITH